MTNPVYVGAAVEVVRMLLQAVLTLVMQAGLSEDQLDDLLWEERDKFQENHPDNLPLPPAVDEEDE